MIVNMNQLLKIILVKNKNYHFKSIIQASYVVSQMISKNNRAFTDAEFIKNI